MSYKLDKPYTDEQRTDFIFRYNQDCFGEGHNCSIEETETALYALEPNELLVDDEVIINPEWDEIQLAERKKERIQENNNLRDTALLGGVTYQNVLFDSDTDQKINLLATVSTMSDTDTLTWYGMDNQGLLCTKADLVAIGQLITELHSFCWQNNAYIKAAVTWVANKSISLPEDYEKTRQIFDVARKKNVDIQKYKTFGELMSAPEMQKKEKEKKAFNPDEAKTFSNKRTVRVSSRREFVVYDVEDTEEGQQEVVALVLGYIYQYWQTYRKRKEILESIQWRTSQNSI